MTHGPARRRIESGALALCFVAIAAAASAAEPPRLVPKSQWATAPSEADYARVVSPKAKEGRSNALADLLCDASRDGALSGCRIISEYPQGAQIGQSALWLAPIIRVSAPAGQASAAGKVIEAFGQFVVGGNYIVGFVIFLALIAIQFLVISHGAVRTAEVTARFTLDAMPGKQMTL